MLDAWDTLRERWLVGVPEVLASVINDLWQPGPRTAMKKALGTEGPDRVAPEPQ